MSLARNRLRLFPTSVGTRSTQGGGTTTQTRDNGSERCVDTVGNYNGGNALSITRTRARGGLLSGSRIVGGIETTWNDFPVDVLPKAASLNPFTMTEATAALKGYNLSNPSRHGVLAPAFLVELRELPKMLRFTGRILSASEVPRELVMRSIQIWYGQRGNQHRRGLSPDEVALLVAKRLHGKQQGISSAAAALSSANLAYKFGWQPLISDIVKTVGFAGAVEQRRLELNRLYSGRGLKRKITLQDTSVDSDQSIIVDSVLGNVAVGCRFRNRTRQWTVARWKPRDPTALPPADWQILQTFLGLDVHGVSASAWELLRWSWLIDYFTNFGDYLELSSNSFNAVATISVMRHQQLSVTFPTTYVSFGPGGGKTVTAFERIGETKTRRIGLPDLTGILAKTPIIGANQLSILGSLGILKYLGK